MAGHEWEDWFEREEFIGQISDMRVQNLQVEREVVQKRTFTRWMNLHLEKCVPPIEVHDLFRDIQDGHILMALLEELSGCKLLHGFKKSSHRIFRLNNIAKVLSFLEERNVKLVSIDAADVADGNPSIILGLIWNIILFFQIKELTGNIRSQFPSTSSLSSIPTSSDSDASYSSTPSDDRQSACTAMREHSKAIKKLLQWVQKRTRKYGVAVQDFGKSWTSGLAFLAVIKSIDPSLVDMRKALLRTARENLEDAFRIAHFSLGIPRLLEPEEVCQELRGESSSTFQLPEEEESLLSLLYQVSCVHGPVGLIIVRYEAHYGGVVCKLYDGFVEWMAEQSLVKRVKRAGLSMQPCDVTINRPDEQSIITYVSQFLEHFPGMEEQEEACQLIERSVSMCRLNFRDSDSDHKRNFAHQSRVRERSYMFQRDSAQPPPKILISSVSEDRSVMSPPFRPAKVRSWSSEDFLADSPHMDDFSSSVVDEPKEPSSEVSTNSTYNSPQLSYAHSPTGSSVAESINTESVIGDSAISSPDSWGESEFGVMPEKFCESRSDSSLCDSGTAWDVYRATPVEVTTLDEGFVPSIESNEHLISDSYIDEGIYSLSSLERTQERIQEPSEKKEAEVVKENHNQNMTLEQVPDHREADITKEVDSKQMDASLLQKGDIPRKQEPSFGLCDGKALGDSATEDLLETIKTNLSQLNTELPPSDNFEELVKQTSTEKGTESLMKAVDFNWDRQDSEGQVHGQTESRNERNNFDEVEVETECQKTDSPSEETGRGSGKEPVTLKEGDEGFVGAQQDVASEAVLDPHESFSLEICDVLANTHPTNQDEASKTSLHPGTGINIPIISISSESEEQDEEGTRDPERQDHSGDDVEETGSKGTDADVISPQNPDELSCDSSENNNKNPADIPSCLVSENPEPRPSAQIRHTEIGLLNEAGEHNIIRPPSLHTCGSDSTDNMGINETKQESEPLHHNSETCNTDKDLIAQTSLTDAKSQPVNTEQEIHSPDPPDRHQDKLGDTLFDNKTTTAQQNTLDPVNSKLNCMTEISSCEPDSVSKDIDLFYTDFDQNPTDDLDGDPIEPMDLFYPDKEEPMFTEPPDTEMQSWPSVLSVSALQPAPASVTESDDQPLNLLGEDFRNGVDVMQKNDKMNMITNTNQETDKASESHDHCLLPGEKIGGLWGGDVPADGGDLSETKLQGSDSSRENTEAMRYVFYS
ncbi:hypothetical protein L3Q82_026855 [Scortum barcoo]|uniref:Uncharacterized protein n=1 Tax=Scortum barcoo TaxID=214431 RepID=A0ACB8WJL9_9TELE|nr:hypothetical protein L3Q82_026855 [Scortum barcoo]